MKVFYQSTFMMLLMLTGVVASAQQMPGNYPPPLPMGPQGYPNMPSSNAPGAAPTTPGMPSTSDGAPGQGATGNQSVDTLFNNADVDHFDKQDAAGNIFGSSAGDAGE